MTTDPTEYGALTQPHPVEVRDYRIRMRRDAKKILWENLSALMHHHYGGENLGRLASKAKVGPATMTRVKKQSTSVGIDIVEAFGRVFGLEPWQMLVPDLNVVDTPMLASDSAEMKVLVANIAKSNEALTGLLRHSGNTEPGALPEPEPTPPTPPRRRLHIRKNPG